MTKTFQEMHRDRQRSAFVGRASETKKFEENLHLSIEDPSRRSIVAISGQGGMGKTTFMARCRDVATAFNFSTAWTNEEEGDLVSVMARLAEDLNDENQFSEFFKERNRYREKRHEVEADPNAPADLAQVIGSAAGRVGTVLARRVPVAGVAMDFVGEDAMGEQLTEVTSFVLKRMKQHGDARLVLEPVEILTPLFLAGFKAIMKSRPVALFFDTYEETRHVVEPWLLHLLDGHFGAIPANFLIVIAGRFSLSPDTWAAYEGFVERVELHPLSPDESRDFLTRKGVTTKRAVDEVVQLAQGMPIFLVSLTIGTPEHPQVADTAVERVLRSVSSPLRKVAIRGALPRLLNRDVSRLIIDGSDPDAAFDWLTNMPFVRGTSAGWKYHNVIRHEFLKHARRESPNEWEDTQRKLAGNCKERRDEALEVKDGQKAFQYEIERSYHKICAGDVGELKRMISWALRAWTADPNLARPWATAMRDGEEDGGGESGWGAECLKAIDELGRAHDQSALRFLTRLLERGPLEEDARIDALVARGDLYYLQSRLDAALDDIEAAIAIHEEEPRLFYERAWINFAAGRLDEGLGDCDRAIELLPEDDPRNTRYQVTKVTIARHMIEPKEALEQINEVLKAGNDAVALLTRGRIFRDLKCPDEAIADFERVAEQDPGRRHEGQEEIGITHFQSGRHEEAIAIIKSNLSATPFCETCWTSLALAYAETEGSETVERLLLDTAADVEEPAVHAFRGLGLLEVDLTQAAQAQLELAVDGDPTNPDFRLWLARVLHRSRMTGEGMRQIEEALRLRSDWPEALVTRGLLRAQMGDFSGAEDDWGTAEREDPSESNGARVNARGLALSILGRYEDSIRYFDRVLADETSPQAAYNRAIARSRVVGPESAGEELRAAERVVSESSEMVVQKYGRAGIRCVLGDEEDALRELRNAIAIDPVGVRKWARDDPAWAGIRGQAAFELAVSGGFSN